MSIQVGRLRISGERNGKFHWLPIFEGHREHDPVAQDFANYLWFASIYWLYWCVDLTRKKT